ncbi:MAG: prolyl oligopeptidase family serine peptidase [Gemmataceae bacterium]
MKPVLAAVGVLLAGPLALAQKPDPKPDMDKLLEKLTITKDKASLPYRLMKPDGYTKDGTDRYPLVVFLHGIGERGKDNAIQLKNGVERFVTAAARKKHPCFLVVPQCPSDKMWVNIRNTKANQTFADQPTEPAALVLDLIDALGKEYRVDADRIYLTGVSMGGYGTWDLICRKPDLFAAALPVCGGGDPAQADKLTKLPIWVFHGDKDTAVPPERSRDMVAAIKKAGGKPEYTEFPGVGHDSWTPTYKDDKTRDWLFAQKKGK